MACLIFACREPIDISVPNEEKKIVLNGFLTADSSVRIHLSKSIGILETNKQIEFLKNANVQLYENGNFIEQLQYDTNGYYVGNTLPQINGNYKITANASPLNPVDAETKILPAPAPFEFQVHPKIEERVQTWYNEETGQPFDTTIKHLGELEVELSINDPANENNIYFLTFTIFADRYEHFPPDFEPVFMGKDELCLNYDSENLPWENWYYSRDLEGCVFSDNLFNGSVYKIKTRIFSEQYSETEELIDTVFINLYSVNEDFFQYVTSYSKYEDAYGNPLSEPVNVFSNINGGFGIFSGFAIRKDTIIIDYD